MRRAGAILAGVLAVAGLLLGAPASGQASSPGVGAEASVIDGVTAPIAEFPWLAYVEYEGRVEEFACTGTVIAPRLVLTAAHCAVSEAGRVLRANGYQVTWGTANAERGDPARIADVTKVLVHPGYNPNNFLHDAALLILAAPVGAPPIPLATAADSDLYKGGTPITIAGWGLTDGDARDAPSTFRTGETQIGTSSYCERTVFSDVVPFEPGFQLCASDRRRHEFGACSGDSGGPGIAHRADGTPVQVGIISTGGPFCELSFPEIQTRVDRIGAWIASWYAAVEAGAPAPPIAPPRLFRLPKLTFPDARLFTFLVLAGEFRRSFLTGDSSRPDCRRLDRVKVKCEVTWRTDRMVYGGGVTIYYVLPREGALVRFSYRIRRVHKGCWQRTGGFRRCPGPVFVDERF